MFRWRGSHGCVHQWLCGQGRLSRRGVGYKWPLPGGGDVEPTLPSEKWVVCLRWRQRAELEWTCQCSGSVHCAAQRGRVPFDWFHPFWWSMARLRTSIQGLFEAIWKGSKSRDESLSNKHWLRDLLLLLDKIMSGSSQYLAEELINLSRLNKWGWWSSVVWKTVVPLQKNIQMNSWNLIFALCSVLVGEPVGLPLYSVCVQVLLCSVCVWVCVKVNDRGP